MGASAWDYYVAYQPDLGVALRELRRRVFEAGDYWWAEPNEFKPASEFADWQALRLWRCDGEL